MTSCYAIFLLYSLLICHALPKRFPLVFHCNFKRFRVSFGLVFVPGGGGGHSHISLKTNSLLSLTGSGFEGLGDSPTQKLPSSAPTPVFASVVIF